MSDLTRAKWLNLVFRWVDWQQTGREVRVQAPAAPSTGDGVSINGHPGRVICSTWCASSDDLGVWVYVRCAKVKP